VELFVQIALMFFFIQFLAVTMIMAIALLFARPEVPTFGAGAKCGAFSRSVAVMVQLWDRVHGTVVRLARAVRPGAH
jgi:hypothetical protein